MFVRQTGTTQWEIRRKGRNQAKAAFLVGEWPPRTPERGIWMKFRDPLNKFACQAFVNRSRLITMCGGTDHLRSAERWRRHGKRVTKVRAERERHRNCSAGGFAGKSLRNLQPPGFFPHSVGTGTFAVRGFAGVGAGKFLPFPGYQPANLAVSSVDGTCRQAAGKGPVGF